MAPDPNALRALVDTAADQHQFSGAVRVDVGDETVLDVAYGSADRRHGIRNTVDTRFGTASVTKGITALTTVALSERGSLSLDGEVRHFLGDDLPLVDDRVTVRQLLAHRSGIGDYLDEEELGSSDDHVLTVPAHELDSVESYLEVIDGFPQREEPGSVFRYNNGGYVVLSIVCERATGRRFQDLVAESVLRPAGMGSTAFLRSDELPADAATGYLSGPGLRTNVMHLPVLGAGDGGIYSTTGDLRRLWAALRDRRVVSEDSVVEMLTPTGSGHGQRYGLGFWLADSGLDVALVGMDCGVSARSDWSPDTDRVVTVVANDASGAWPMSAVLTAAMA